MSKGNKGIRMPKYGLSKIPRISFFGAIRYTFGLLLEDMKNLLFNYEY